MKLHIHLTTLPASYPLMPPRGRDPKRFQSPLRRLLAPYTGMALGKMETINAFALAPWETRILVRLGDNETETSNIGVPQTEDRQTGIEITIAALNKESKIAIGGAALFRFSHSLAPATFATNFSDRAKNNLYTAELEALGLALWGLPQYHEPADQDSIK